ncbi:MAG: prepilin-type N-terminal cleavage/methylation domain-containing protein [Gemmatimonadota bacterium]|nr:MAG: prepilin-type N-terminal cleavage/methylation domain-containing protein [Gemmatimonadota bacterium]
MSRGFTLVEVLIALTLTGIVVAGTLQALSAQKKFYARQARILDARHAMRASTTILSSELREVSAASGDLYSVSRDSVAFRSTVGFGVICRVSASTGSLALTQVSGHLRLELADSLLVFVERTQQDGDDSWRALAVSGISTGGGGCAERGSSERVLTVSGDLSGIWVGAPARLFRAYVFKLFEMDGRWWLGRRKRGSSLDYVPVAGPLAPPGSSGLRLTYFRGDGAATVNPTQVVRVSIDVRAPTNRTLSDPDYRLLSTSVYLRNND